MAGTLPFVSDNSIIIRKTVAFHLLLLLLFCILPALIIYFLLYAHRKHTHTHTPVDEIQPPAKHDRELSNRSTKTQMIQQQQQRAEKVIRIRFRPASLLQFVFKLAIFVAFVVRYIVERTHTHTLTISFYVLFGLSLWLIV